MIDIHSFDSSFLAERGEKVRDIYLEIHKRFTSDTLDRLEMFATDCLSLCVYYEHHEMNHLLTAKYFSLGQRSMKWYFKLAMEEEGIVTPVQLDEEWFFNIETDDTQSYLDFETWRTTLMLAVIARDKEAIDWLMEFPEQRMRDADGKGEEYQYLINRFLKSLFQGDKNVGQLLLEAYKAADPELVEEDMIDMVLDLDIPTLNVWENLLSNDEQRFNKSLETALLLSKKRKMDQPRKVKILIDYTCTALATLAFDKGWNVEVTSPYMPRWMIEGIM